MSTAAVGEPTGIAPSARRAEAASFKALAVALSVITLVLIVTAASRSTLGEASWIPIAWIALVGCASFVSIPTGDGVSLSMDLPLLLGVAAIYDPALSGAIALLGATDPREWQRRISGWLAAYNRSQVALSVMAASLVFHAVGGRVGVWPWAAVAAFLALSVDCAVNYTFVAVAVSLRFSRSLKSALGTLRLGDPRVFLPIYLSFGLLGVLVAETYAGVGLAGVVLFVGPVVLAHQAFTHRGQLERFTKSLSLRTKALEEVNRRIVDERRDERLVLAGDIHDEVLPPLFKVHLMGEVLRRDLESGRLLDLDDDLPQLLEATNTAQEAIRRVLRNLRAMPAEGADLGGTIRLLARSVEHDSHANVHLDLGEVQASSVTQLLLYQVAREALHNCAKHARAENIFLQLARTDTGLRLVIRDDGIGFHPDRVDRDAHFGLELLAERLESAGGVLHVESKPGAGTTIVAKLPADD